MENGNSNPVALERADSMFTKMCKKFKSKKQVWIAHLQYLLRGGRHREAHALAGRAMKSLPKYKHVETMSKFAQFEFEFGSAERARTVFDGLLVKYPKRLDLVFVYADKEVKHGKIESVRVMFERIANGTSPSRDGGEEGGANETRKTGKVSDKQMKSLFKKWFRIEEQHGTEESQERVKNAARSYVERTTSEY